MNLDRTVFLFALHTPTIPHCPVHSALTCCVFLSKLIWTVKSEYRESIGGGVFVCLFVCLIYFLVSLTERVIGHVLETRGVCQNGYLMTLDKVVWVGGFYFHTHPVEQTDMKLMEQRKTVFVKMLRTTFFLQFNDVDIKAKVFAVGCVKSHKSVHQPIIHFVSRSHLAWSLWQSLVSVGYIYRTFSPLCSVWMWMMPSYWFVTGLWKSIHAAALSPFDAVRARIKPKTLHLFFNPVSKPKYLHLTFEKSAGH